MISEQYVSFEVAKLLKEKGFNELCYEWYNPFGSHHNSAFAFNNEDYKNINKISAPTQQMAMRWLREVHNICCEICCYREKDESGFVFCFLVLPLNSQAFYQTSKYSTYEDATEAAIKYCLEHFSEILLSLQYE